MACQIFLSDFNLLNTISIITMIALLFQSIMLYQQTKAIAKQSEILAKQTKLIEKELVMSSFNSSYSIFIESDKIYVEHPELRKFTGKKEIVEDIEKGILTKEKLQEIAIITLRLNLMQLNFNRKKYQFRNDEGSDHKSLRQILKNPFVIEYWKSKYKSTYDDDFENEVNKIIKEIDDEENSNKST